MLHLYFFQLLLRAYDAIISCTLGFMGVLEIGCRDGAVVHLPGMPHQISVVEHLRMFGETQIADHRLTRRLCTQSVRT